MRLKKLFSSVLHFQNFDYGHHKTKMYRKCITVNVENTEWCSTVCVGCYLFTMVMSLVHLWTRVWTEALEHDGFFKPKVAIFG